MEKAKKAAWVNVCSHLASKFSDLLFPSRLSHRSEDANPCALFEAPFFQSLDYEDDDDAGHKNTFPAEPLFFSGASYEGFIFIKADGLFLW